MIAELVGRFFSAMTTVPAGAVPFQSLGLSATAWSGGSLPLDLAPFQMPGCRLYHDAADLFLPRPLAGSVATHALVVPNRAAFAGWEVYLQGYVFAPGSNAAGVLTSNALALTLGY